MRRDAKRAAVRDRLTLDELAKLTHYLPASISAQLRHLRKPEYADFTLSERFLREVMMT